MAALHTRDPARAAEVLRGGGLVVYPTETFYGLGALAGSAAAVARLAAAKLRPEGKPLPLVAADPAMAMAVAASFPPLAERLAARFWPGPLNLVLPRRAEVAPSSIGGRSTVAVRSPAHPARGWSGCATMPRILLHAAREAWSRAVAPFEPLRV